MLKLQKRRGLVRILVPVLSLFTSWVFSSNASEIVITLKPYTSYPIVQIQEAISTDTQGSNIGNAYQQQHNIQTQKLLKEIGVYGLSIMDEQPSSIVSQKPLGHFSLMGLNNQTFTPVDWLARIVCPKGSEEILICDGQPTGNLGNPATTGSIKASLESGGSALFNLEDLEYATHVPDDDAPGYPEVVAFLYTGSLVPTVRCSGVLLTQTLVLTAAHCFSEETPPMTDIEVFVGRSIQNDDGSNQRLGIKKVIPAPDDIKDSVDAAIIVLKTPVKANFYGSESPFNLPLATGLENNSDQSFLFKNGSGYLGIIVGFGVFTSGGTRGTKHHAGVYVLPCIEELTDLTECELETTFVTSHVNNAEGGNGTGADSCAFDSGGPLFFLDPALNEVPTLVGIIKKGFKVDGSENYCGHGGVYTRIDTPKVLAWINATISEVNNNSKSLIRAGTCSVD